MSGRIFFQAHADDQAPCATTNVATTVLLGMWTRRIARGFGEGCGPIGSLPQKESPMRTDCAVHNPHAVCEHNGQKP
jgi:hypothetical protein